MTARHLLAAAVCALLPAPTAREVADLLALRLDPTPTLQPLFTAPAVDLRPSWMGLALPDGLTEPHRTDREAWG